MKLRFLIIFLMFYSFNLFACNVNPAYKDFNKGAFKGPPVEIRWPAEGVKIMTSVEAMKLVKNEKYVFIDVRKASDYKKCSIRKSRNLEYTVSGDKKNQFTKKTIMKLVKEGKTIVTFCNAVKCEGDREKDCNFMECYRSLNASIEACKWGIPVKQIKWLATGVPGIVETAKQKMGKYVKGRECATFLPRNR